MLIKNNKLFIDDIFSHKSQVMIYHKKLIFINIILIIIIILIILIKNYII